MSKSNISIIMPVYNAEAIIENSIKSALHQTVSGLEIICIDDGSVDASRAKIRQLQESYPQIRLLEQKHMGAGPARNLGIEAAKGRYIAFLDADDEFVDEKALEMMVEACDVEHAVICGSRRIYCMDGEEQEAELFENYVIKENGNFIEYKDFQYDFHYQSFIFDRDFLVRNQIWFPPYMRYQDPPFFVKAMATAGRFFVIPVILYKYKCNFLKQGVVIKYTSHILHGIYDTLKIAEEKGYQKLFCTAVERIDGGFHDTILQNLSDEALELLLTINKMSLEERGKGLQILSDLYKMPGRLQSVSHSRDLMRKIVMIKQQKTGFQDFFARQGLRKVVVYGLGLFGRILVNELRACGIEIVCGIDRKVSEYQNLLVIKPEDKVPECDALIVSLADPEEVVAFYEEAEDVRVFAFAWMIQKIADEIDT
ncbi:MAG: glycosyltransferase family 2 protein [Lachnospiraceae bacterium]|jgi:glycosyltransferase involved in cell wall biosynthesis|nr:glycosyltransferase family 2 protein [Lachnospiraceae bacterium]